MKNLTFRLAAASAAFASLASASAQTTWALSGGGVWRFKNGALGRVAFNPAVGNIGNMGAAGVSFSSAAPAAVQGGAAAGNAAVAQAFARWDALKIIPFVRIKLVAGANANLPVTWAANLGTPGVTGNAAVNANPRSIRLNTGEANGRGKTLRTDGWNIDKPGTRNGLIDEYDVFGTTFHESGHGIGLHHPASNAQVMTPQDRARTAADGKFRAVEQTTPFAGQPTDLAGAALPAGARAYLNPRGNMGFGDLIGAATIYSAPIAQIASVFTAGGGGGGRNRFAYTLTNGSGLDTATGMRTGYLSRSALIPVADGIDVTNLQIGAGWTARRDRSGIRIEAEGDGGLLPGESLDFSFDSSAIAGSALPQVRWRVEGLGDPVADGDGEEDMGMAPEFDPTDFGVDDGTFTYRFDDGLDDWQMIRMDSVVTPVPEPASLLALAAGALALLRRRNGRPK